MATKCGSLCKGEYVLYFSYICFPRQALTQNMKYYIISFSVIPWYPSWGENKTRQTNSVLFRPIGKRCAVNSIVVANIWYTYLLKSFPVNAYPNSGIITLFVKYAGMHLSLEGILLGKNFFNIKIILIPVLWSNHWQRWREHKKIETTGENTFERSNGSLFWRKKIFESR